MIIMIITKSKMHVAGRCVLYTYYKYIEVAVNSSKCKYKYKYKYLSLKNKLYIIIKFIL